MKELTIQKLSKSYGTKDLLKGVDLSIRTGDRIGLIGPNGTGKSSFLKVLAGVEGYDQGEISRPKDYSIAYLAQTPQLDPDKTILETVYDSQAPMVQLVRTYSQVLQDLQDQPQDSRIQDQFNRVSDQMSQAGAWDFESQARTVLTQLGLTRLNRQVKACSGGEQKRIGLAQVLIEPADLLILDEPTNHLDIQSIRWLERVLHGYPGALIMVTHDRYFLDRVVNQIIDLRFGRFHHYAGSYQAYLAQRAEAEAIQAQRQAKEDRVYAQELAWMRSGARARTTKQQARIHRFEDLAARRSQRDKEADALQMDFSQQRIGKQVLDLEEVSMEIAGQLVIQDFTKHFVKGDRLGVVGPNGVGKSTFLNALAGLHPISQGSLDRGQTVRLAYYRQLDQDLPGDSRVLAYIQDLADRFAVPGGPDLSASQVLERFNFSRDMHGARISSLSGGEKRRLYLLSLLVQQPNVLLLDEPTNDLDIDTLNVLEDYLLDFEGVVVAVSHDRYFLDKLANQVLLLEGQGRYQIHPGNYSQCQDKFAEGLEGEASQASQAPASDTSKPSVSNKPPRSKQVRLSYQEKQEWQTLEETIYALEDQISQIQADMVHYSQDAGKLMDLHSRLQDLEAQLLHHYDRYEYLSNKVEAMQGGSSC